MIIANNIYEILATYVLVFIAYYYYYSITITTNILTYYINHITNSTNRLKSFLMMILTNLWAYLTVSV